MAKEKMISELPAEAFLIKDKSLKDIDAPFFAWLRENGFKTAWHKGHYGWITSGGAAGASTGHVHIMNSAAMMDKEELMSRR